MNNQIYDCRCGCGRAFTSIYTTTGLCPSCCQDRLWISYEPDELPDEDSLFAATGFLLTHCFRPDILGSWYQPRRTAPSFALLRAIVIIAVLILGYLATMGQAHFQGWGE